MMSYSEKSIRKLQENFACFGDKLADEDVYSCFCTIISKSRSFAKPTAKVGICQSNQLCDVSLTKWMSFKNSEKLPSLVVCKILYLQLYARVFKYKFLQSICRNVCKNWFDEVIKWILIILCRYMHTSCLIQCRLDLNLMRFILLISDLDRWAGAASSAVSHQRTGGRGDSGQGQPGLLPGGHSDKGEVPHKVCQNTGQRQNPR